MKLYLTGATGFIGSTRRCRSTTRSLCEFLVMLLI